MGCRRGVHVGRPKAVGERTMTFTIAMLAGLFLQAGSVATLPATPQGKIVEGFVKAFNAGEAAFLKYQEQHMVPSQKRTPEERKAMYARMRGDFGDLKVLSVPSASA